MCNACHTSFGFELASGKCELPLENGIDCVAKYVVIIVVVAIVVGVGMKRLIVKFIAEDKSRFEAITSRIGLSKDLVADELGESIFGTEVTTLSNEAIMTGIKHWRYALMMDWTEYKGAAPTQSKFTYNALVEGVQRLRPRFYPPCQDLHHHDIVGVALPLFNDFNVLVMCSAACALAVTWLASVRSGLSAVVAELSQIRADGGADDARMLETLGTAVLQYAETMWYGLGFLYVLLLFMALAHAIWANVFAKRFNALNSTMSDYVLQLTSVPPSLTSEKELQEILESSFGVPIVGVSIGYDLSAPNVADKIYQMSERLLVRRDYSFDSSKVDQLDPGMSFGYDKKLAAPEVENSEKADMEEFRSLFNGTDIKGSGSAFVVFHSKADVGKAYEAHRIFLVEGNEVEARTIASEPTSVLWSNFGVLRATRMLSLVKANFIVVLTFVLLYICVYRPLNRYVMRPYAMVGSAPKAVTQQTLGIIFAIVGNLLGAVLWQSCSGVGYYKREDLDKLLLNFSVLTTFFNVVYANFNYLHRKCLGGFNATPLTGGAGLDAVLAESDVSEAFYFLMFPGFLFTGPLTGQIVGNVLPIVQNFLLFKLLFVWRCLPTSFARMVALAVGSPDVTKGLSARTAEQAFQPHELGLAWDYANYIVNPSACFLTLFVLSDTMWMLFLVTVIWAVFTSFTYRYMVLPLSKKQVFPSSSLEERAEFWWGIPVSIIAAAWAFWGVRLGRLGSFDAPVIGEWWPVLASFLLSLLAYWTVIFKLDRRRAIEIYAVSALASAAHLQEKDEPYEDVASRLLYTWFNTNPVHVLKSHYRPEDLKEVTPLAPFYYGKEYLVLQQRAEAEKDAEKDAENETD